MLTYLVDLAAVERLPAPELWLDHLIASRVQPQRHAEAASRARI